MNIGIVTSPMFYHSTYQLESSSGVVITGSHNPGEYNGFKIVFKNNSTSSEEILSLKERILNKEFSEFVLVFPRLFLDFTRFLYGIPTKL